MRTIMWGKKTAPFYFCNGFVSTKSITIILAHIYFNKNSYHLYIPYSLYCQRRGTSVACRSPRNIENNMKSLQINSVNLYFKKIIFVTVSQTKSDVNAAVFLCFRWNLLIFICYSSSVIFSFKQRLENLKNVKKTLLENVALANALHRENRPTPRQSFFALITTTCQV